MKTGSQPQQERAERASPSTVEAQRNQSSLDITQRLERKLAQLNKSDNVLKRWIYEIVTWTVSASCMAAIIMILLRLNNQEFQSRDTLAIAFTVLSKIASAALLLPVSEAIGQLKWNWFNGQKSKELWDFEIFDKASRGVWGSILLLFRTRGRSLAALGALLTLLLIANDTFFQQVINYSSHSTLAGESFVSRVVQYTPKSALPTRAGLSLTIEDYNIRPLLERFLFGRDSQPMSMGERINPDIPILCPTNNCTFPQYNTLGVCSRCVDVSDLLQFMCRAAPADWVGNLTRNWEYPNRTMCGYFLNATGPAPVMMFGYSLSEEGLPGEALLGRIFPLFTIPDKKAMWGGSIHFKGIQNVIQDAIVATYEGDPANVYRSQTPIAEECIICWCIKTMESTYLLDNYREKVIKTSSSSQAGAVIPWDSYPLNLDGKPGTFTSYAEDIAIRDISDPKVYGMDNLTHINVDAIFWNTFPSFLTAEPSSAPILRYRTYLEGHAYLRQPKTLAWLPPNNLTVYFERMGIAMTNAIRSSDSREMIKGSAHAMQTVVSVQWAWLAFPFALLFLSLAFLVATIIKTTKEAVDGPGVWKTSAMPTLIYSLPNDMQKQYTSTSGSETSLDGAKRLKIRLHPQKGWRVSGQPNSPMVVIRSNQPPPGWI
ncbi:unnamed protein product [Periconia digitata]|uniref:DUF3176 domain containing protein n=1 Tax=Periconia digitata TaxID=1303443 RepID=A0A9W4U6E3_9PLEO|nr:unnamed protein product [Periconia digitata]